jgi:nicotinate-nucleotide adenylyltransferase
LPQKASRSGSTGACLDFSLSHRPLRDWGKRFHIDRKSALLISLVVICVIQTVTPSNARILIDLEPKKMTQYETLFQEQEKFNAIAARPRHIILFGGSFDPPHFGHLSIVFWLLGVGKATEVWLMPCWRHAFGKRLSPFKHRLEMCLQAARLFHHGQCRVCSIEKEIGGRSITLNTVRELKRREFQRMSVFPPFKPCSVAPCFSLVIGLDNWLVRHKWEGFDQLEKECQIIVIGKDDQPRLPEIRSTMVRDRIAAGEDVSLMVPAGVLSYIEKHGLYLRKKG